MTTIRPDDVIGSSAEQEEIAQAGLIAQMGMMRRALWASPVRNTLILLSVCPALGRCGDRVRPNPVEQLESALLRRSLAPKPEPVRQTTRRLRHHRGRAIGAQRRAAMVHRDAEAAPARRAGPRSGRKLAGAGTRLPPGQRRRDRRQSRPTHARGRTPFDGVVGGFGDRIASGIDTPRDLRQHPMVHIDRLRLSRVGAPVRKYPAIWYGPPSSIRARPLC